MIDDCRPSLLVISFVTPAPTGSGARMRAWAWLETLRRHYRVHLLVFGESAEADLAARVQSLTVPGTQWACMHRAPDPARGSLRFLLDTLVRQPVGICRPTASECRKIAAALPQQAFDAVFAIRLSMAVVATQLLDAGVICAEPLGFDLDDRESLLAQRRARLIGLSQGRLVALEAGLRGPRLDRIERQMFRRWPRVFVCSRADAADLAVSCDAATFAAVPNTLVDPGMLPDSAAPARAGSLLFVGSLAYAPNEDGLAWFMGEVWPKLRQRAATTPLSLAVVGRSPTARVRALTDTQAVTLCADVPDVTPHYADADVVVVPLRIGGGTRIKIIEALALGRAVVSTSQGAEGLDVRHGHDILIADDAAAFADACLWLLDDPARCDRLRRNGRATFERGYTPKAFAREAGAALGLTA